MKIGVMGAGAVGCYFGAMLARAGYELIFIGRPAFVGQVRRHGLRLQHRDFDLVLPVTASEDAAGLADADLILFTVKSSDTETAGRAMANCLRDDALVLSLQNGVDNAERLSAILSRPVHPVATYVAVEMAGPGHVRHHGRGELLTGDFPGAVSLCDLLGRAGIPATHSAQVDELLWSKLLINCAYNALSAVAQHSYAEMTAIDGVTGVMAAAVDECVAVARAAGVALGHPGMAQVLALVTAMPAQRSSTAQDLARGRPTEIEHLNGHVVRLGSELGVPTPVNATLLAVVRLLAAKQAATDREFQEEWRKR